MTGLMASRDDFSVRVTSDASELFFVRLDTDASGPGHLVFSDFRLPDDGDALAIEALLVLDANGFSPRTGTKLVFQDIFPAYRDSRDQEALLKRHQQLVSSVRGYADQTGLAVGDVLLDQNPKGYMTVVKIE